jgi:pyruvate formate lyase activating enzyme
MSEKAKFYEVLADGSVVCNLCPHHCHLISDKTGICGVRRNDDGVLIAESYGKVTSLSLDPIEKKPLYHFYPGSRILSLGSYGCNFHCGFCQNYQISMDYTKNALYNKFSPEDIASASMKYDTHGNIGMAYTYNEPLINYEFIYDCAELIAKQNQKNVLVTNGYICREPLEILLPFIHAMNIDVKSFNSAFYKNIGGNLDNVLATVKTAAQKCHVEITTLIIPGKNDSPQEMRELSKWLAGISKNIPLHISRFFPSYKWRHIPPTPVETIMRLVDVARENLKYVYSGNC